MFPFRDSLKNPCEKKLTPNKQYRIKAVSDIFLRDAMWREGVLYFSLFPIKFVQKTFAHLYSEFLKNRGFSIVPKGGGGVGAKR